MWRLGACVLVVAACSQEGATGAEGPAGPEGPAGIAGAKGDPGADGQLRIYGNGSAGALDVTANGVLFTNVATNGNLQFTDVTIAAGVTLTVPSGTVIRCSGTFTNHGTIVVSYGAGNARTRTSGGLYMGTLDAAHHSAHPGLTAAPATSGEVGDNTQIRSPGAGGLALPAPAGRNLLLPGPFGGGGGGTSLIYPGGRGGGSLVVLAGTAITNDGILDASGENASFSGGGGGGGIIVLATPGAIASTMIKAKGGNGGPTIDSAALGGGGGGGLVHLLAPAIVAGTIDVGGGALTAQVQPISATIRGSGGGGGAGVGGDGGGGGVVGPGPNNLVNNAEAGDVGVVYQTLVDPTALF